jgi:hypothetical protein
MNWKPEVKISGNWEHNRLVFATKEEAEISAHSLFMRWTLAEDHRAVESSDPVNYVIVDGEMSPVREGA